jgi:hypothetical protein
MCGKKSGNSFIKKNTSLSVAWLMRWASHLDPAKALTQDLNMWQIIAKFVPCLLTDQQKQNHANACQDLREKLQRNLQFLLNVFTV